MRHLRIVRPQCYRTLKSSRRTARFRLSIIVEKSARNLSQFQVPRETLVLKDRKDLRATQSSVQRAKLEFLQMWTKLSPGL
jgi:hypothetical protein